MCFIRHYLYSNFTWYMTLDSVQRPRGPCFPLQDVQRLPNHRLYEISHPKSLWMGATGKLAAQGSLLTYSDRARLLLQSLSELGAQSLEIRAALTPATRRYSVYPYR